MRRGALLAAWLVVLMVTGCATSPPVTQKAVSSGAPAPQSVLRGMALSQQLEDQILALDPQRVSDADVRTILASGPTPQIVGLHGGVYPTHLLMESFTRFLSTMGYPETKLVHPGDGRRSHSPYEDSAQIAGLLAWYYEHEGVRPMMVGHSQGGIQAVKVLHELAGHYEPTIHVWNPYTDAAEARTTIVDPLTGAERPVVGVSVGYVSVVAAGGAALLLPNQWSMVNRLQSIPDTVDEFTGYSLGIDLIAWNAPGAATVYRANGAAQVRNVELPAEYSHVMVVAVAGLARDPALRAWLNAYAPDAIPPLPANAQSTDNALWAADVWFNIKKHWVLEAQKVIRARRNPLPSATSTRKAVD
jgi:hypothetical protein